MPETQETGQAEIVRDFTDAEAVSPGWADLLRRNGINPEQPYDTVPTADGVRIIQPSRPWAADVTT